MTVMGLGRKPSPPGHRVLYSAARETGSREGLWGGGTGAMPRETGERESLKKCSGASPHQVILGLLHSRDLRPVFGLPGDWACESASVCKCVFTFHMAAGGSQGSGFAQGVPTAFSSSPCSSRKTPPHPSKPRSRLLPGKPSLPCFLSVTFSWASPKPQTNPQESSTPAALRPLVHR